MAWTKADRAASDKRQRARRKREGICYRCQGTAAPGRTRCAECQEWHRQYAQDWRKKRRQLVFDHYGRVCQCCKTAFNDVFLTLGHINQDGASHRKTIGTEVYSWAIKNNYPNILETQCWNCNCARMVTGGFCPHEKADAAFA
jgi:hypothetical protein